MNVIKSLLKGAYVNVLSPSLIYGGEMYVKLNIFC